MASLEEFGIHRFTAGAINAYRDNPAFWAIRNLYGAAMPTTPKLVRGSAIYEGLKNALYLNSCDAGEDTALRYFEWVSATLGWDRSAEEVRTELDNILPMFGEAVKAINDLGLWQRPATTRLSIPVYTEGLHVPMISCPSFTFYIEDLESTIAVELKTTTRCPKSIPERDAAVMAVNYKARGNSIAIFVTAKKHEIFAISSGEAEESWRDLIMDAIGLQNFLLAANSRDHVMSMLPLNRTQFRWNEYLLDQAREIMQLSREKIDELTHAKACGIYSGPDWDTPCDLLSSD